MKISFRRMVETSVLPFNASAQLINLLERKDVQQQLIEHGVDPEASLARVIQMTY